MIKCDESILDQTNYSRALDLYPLKWTDENGKKINTDLWDRQQFDTVVKSLQNPLITERCDQHLYCLPVFINTVSLHIVQYKDTNLRLTFYALLYFVSCCDILKLYWCFLLDLEQSPNRNITFASFFNACLLVNIFPTTCIIIL